MLRSTLKHFEATTMLCFCNVYITLLVANTFAVQSFENIYFGMCRDGQKDILSLADTYPQCGNRCKVRPICTGLSYHRLTRLCRLHTDEGIVQPSCYGFLYSQKSDWDVMGAISCSCMPGEVCTRPEKDVLDCVKEECQMPNYPEHGKIVGNYVNIGRQILYVCDQGYALTGDAIRVCLSNGLWSGEEPYCTGGTTCPVIGGRIWDNSCYFIVTNRDLKMTFHDASSYCGTDGGNLVHVTSTEEHDFITSQLAIPNNPAATVYWIGTNRNITGSWLMSDNTTVVKYFEWAASEPEEDLDCVAYTYIPTKNKWKWSSYACNADQAFPICEYELATT